MNFELDEQQAELVRAARAGLAQALPPSTLRAHIDPHEGVARLATALWDWVARMGWTSLRVREPLGGLGLGLTEATLLHEELGRALFVGPFTSTCVFAVEVLQATSGFDAALRGIAEGRVRVATATLRTQDALALRGLGSLPSRLAFECVGHAPAATHFLLTGEAAEDSAVAVWLPRESVTVLQRQALDPTHALGSVHWTPGAGPDPTVFPLSSTQLACCRAGTRLARCGELLGVAERALQSAVTHASERKQFGRPIGSFQAIKHLLADDFIALENARTAVRHAAWSCDAAAEDALLAADVAVAACVPMVRRVTSDAIQVHGGMGYTWEADPQLFFKRAQRLSAELGGDAGARRRIAGAVLDDGAVLLQ